MSAPAVLERLEALGFRQQPNGWTAACCPAHDDRAASFGWKQDVTDDGRATVVLRCQAGCANDAIVAALGATMADLFAPRADGTGTTRARIVRTTRYEVKDADRVVQAVHVRRDRADGSKDLWWERPDGSRGLGGRPEATLPLYGTHLVAGWDREWPIVIVEGEKCADALAGRAQALATVTGAGNGKCPDAAALAVLAGWHVVLWPDNDDVGREHMRELAARLDGIAASVRQVVPPAGVPPKWDAADAMRDININTIADGTVRTIDDILASATEVPGSSGNTARGSGAPGPSGGTAHESEGPVPPRRTGTSDTSGTPGARALGLPAYLDAARAFVCRFVALPSEHEPVAIALWVAHAVLFERLKARYGTSPILAATSAEKQSGKSRLLDALELLVPEPRRMVLPSEAVVYTVLAQDPRPTLLLDEADAIFGPRTAEKYEGLRAILNSGNRAGSPVLRVRLDGRRREVEAFDVFGPKVVAGIGDLPDTVADRSIPIRMRRRRPDERVERFRQREAEADAARVRLDAPSVALADGYPGVPDELPDRAADGWEVLLAIADTAGGSWPRLARLAAVALSADQPATVTTGVRLLGDVREAFGTAERLTTAELLARLHAMDDAPWGDWYGKPLTARGLARLLAPYGVASRHWREGDATLRGWFAADLGDAWGRYCPAPVPDVSLVPVPPRGTEAPEDDADAPDPGLWAAPEGDAGPDVEDDYPASAWDAADPRWVPA